MDNLEWIRRLTHMTTYLIMLYVFFVHNFVLR